MGVLGVFDQKERRTLWLSSSHKTNKRLLGGLGYVQSIKYGENVFTKCRGWRVKFIWIESWKCGEHDEVGHFVIGGVCRPQWVCSTVLFVCFSSRPVQRLTDEGTRLEVCYHLQRQRGALRVGDLRFLKIFIRKKMIFCFETKLPFFVVSKVETEAGIGCEKQG